MNGGNFLSQYSTVCTSFASVMRCSCDLMCLTWLPVDANYLLKSLQGFQSHGISVYAIGIQVGSVASPARHMRA